MVSYRRTYLLYAYFYGFVLVAMSRVVVNLLWHWAELHFIGILNEAMHGLIYKYFFYHSLFLKKNWSWNRIHAFSGSNRIEIFSNLEVLMGWECFRHFYLIIVNLHLCFFVANGRYRGGHPFFTAWVSR